MIKEGNNDDNKKVEDNDNDYEIIVKRILMKIARWRGW